MGGISLPRQPPLSAVENAFISASIATDRRLNMQQTGFVLVTSLLLIILVIAGPGRWAYFEYQRQKVMQESPLVMLEGGEIVFGADPSQEPTDDPPLERRDVGTFAIESTEVTNAHYRACVEAGFCEKPKITDLYDQTDYAEHPVVYVTFHQAQTYCAWLGRRLPNTYEWELAARGKDGRAWPWGVTPATTENVNMLVILNPEKQEWFRPKNTLPVASLPLGSTKGIYDLVGNVWEWTTSKIGNAYIQRGGSWDTVIYQITNIHPAIEDQADQSVGFRCAE